MNPKMWRILVTALQAMDDLPVWLQKQISLTVDEVMRLPVVDMAAKGEDGHPTIEEKVVKEDYLDFLREQIVLEPRGREWSEVLQSRLEALSPYVDKVVITVMLHCKPHCATIRIPAETETVIHLEIE